MLQKNQLSFLKYWEMQYNKFKNLKSQQLSKLKNKSRC